MRRRSMAEQMFNDVMNTIRESQTDLEKTISQYTSNGPAGPLTDIIEDNDNVMVKIDQPGVKKENMKIDITEDAVEIIAQYEEEVLMNGARYVKRERKNDEVKRIISLPAKIRIEDATAAFENGILTVTLPKIEKKETFGVKVD